MLPIAVDSVMDQEYNNWELIIVNDGSTDETITYLNGLKDKRIQFFNRDHKERSAARNHGIKKACGTHICFLDSDDYLLPNHLSTFHEAIEKFGPKTIIRNGQYLENKNNRKKLNNFDDKVTDIVDYVLFQFYNLSSFCIPLQFVQNNLFPEEFHFWEDKHLLLRLTAQFPVKQTSSFTSVIREHKQRSTEPLDSLDVLNQFEHTVECIKDVWNTMNGNLEIQESFGNKLRQVILSKYKGSLYQLINRRAMFKAITLGYNMLVYKYYNRKNI